MSELREKITLPVAIVLAAIVLAIGFVIVQYNKQFSIERQQALELENQKTIEDAKLQQANEIEAEKNEQQRKEYASDRKDACLDIYQVESDKWNNIRGWRYSADDDQCFIRYKDPDPKSDEVCDKNYPTGEDWGFIFVRENSLCKDGEFENSF